LVTKSAIPLFLLLIMLIGATANTPLAASLPTRQILLNSTTLDTSRPQRQLALPMHIAAKRQLWLVQFAGPIRGEWYKALQATSVRIVSTVPEYAYLVYGDVQQLTKLGQLAAYQPAIHWQAAYQPAWRIDPAVQQDHAMLVMVQLLADPATNTTTIDLMRVLSAQPLRIAAALEYLNIIAELPAGAANLVATQPDVLSIQPYQTPLRHDEVQGQIIAGNSIGNNPSPGDYLVWLQERGFTQAQFDASGFVVDVADAGIDTGTLLPNHFGLYAGGMLSGTSRIAYSRLVGTPTGANSTLAGLDGHGTLNAHIIAGYVPSGAPYNTFPHADAQGLRYGLGIAPFVRVGASVIFDNGGGNDFTNPDYEDLVALAYADAARIVNNSWGGGSSGFYTADSQRYDALVRDAQPGAAVVASAGNQGMVIIFSAGNGGPGMQSIGMPASAKNVISVGASENVRAIGGEDRCGKIDSDADSLNDIAAISSRGPTADGRFKPDLLAPGVRISGGVWQDANPGTLGSSSYNGTGLCIGALSETFFPVGQEWSSSSTGTSHSAPAVAGAAALVRQYLINQGMQPPSPAMTKALLLNSARYLTGVGAADTLPSMNQGMGLLDLGRAFTQVPRIMRDQQLADLFSESGQQRVFLGAIADPTQPLRVTLAWTDAPGPTFAAAYVNNLDLRVEVGGVTYLGNAFLGAYSVASGVSDTRNNVESVFLPAGLVAGTPIRITVSAANIAGDGVPQFGGPLDQDFALVASNARSYRLELPVIQR
jgi:Subtilase family